MHLAEAHMRAWIDATACACGVPVYRLEDVSWAQTGVAWPMFNGGIGHDPASVGRALDDLDPDDGPSFFWWATEVHVDGLRGLMESRGLVTFDDGAPWMQCLVAELPAYEIPAGGEVVEVTDAATAHEWCETLVRAFGFPPVGGERWLEAIQRMGHESAPWRLWTARKDGEPVGVTLGFNGGGVAGLFGMAVVPEARRKGFGALLTLLPLHESAKAGETMAGFFSTDDGMPLYESLGFRPAGSMTRWLGGRSPF